MPSISIGRLQKTSASPSQSSERGLSFFIVGRGEATSTREICTQAEGHCGSKNNPAIRSFQPGVRQADVPNKGAHDGDANRANDPPQAFASDDQAKNSLPCRYE